MALPARAFTPPPKVDSAVVELVPLDGPPASAWADMEGVVAAAFGQRRKMLRQSLGNYVGLADALDATGLQPTQRAETVTVQQFADLASRLCPHAPQGRGQRGRV